MQRFRASLLLLVSALACPSAACGPSRRTAAEAVFPFVDAAQSGDLATLYCSFATDRRRLAGAGDRAAFEAWARARYASFEDGKGRGHVDLDDDGIVMVKAFGLGTGTNLGILAVRIRDRDTLEVDTPATFNYDAIDATSLPPGSTFLVCGLPLGSVTIVRVPDRAGEVGLEVLRRITLRWTLRRSPAEGGCAAGWGVMSVVPVPGSAATTRVSWKF